MNLWYFRCHCSMTAWKVPRWFHDSPGIMHLWLVWWMWCWCGNAAERLWRLEGVNISKGQVRVECMEWSHVAAENTGEHRRMLRMKFYITQTSLTLFSWHESHLFQDLQIPHPLCQLHHHIAGCIGHAGGWLLIYHQTRWWACICHVPVVSCLLFS